MELVAKKYKQTDVGIIPIDWDMKRLLDVSDFSNGKAHEQSIDEAGDFVVVNSKFISTEGEIFKNSNQAISPLAKGDITLVMSDIPNGKALAKCYLIEIDNKYTLNQRICSIKTRVCDNVFLFYVLNRNKYFLSFDSGSGQTNLRRNEVLDCPLAIPPTITEQTAIATALSNIDELIAKTENLIDKKKAIKQGVMQELLKPKKGWVTKKLGDIISEFQNGYGFSAAGYISNGIPIVTMAQIGLDGSFNFNETKVNKWVTSDFNLLKNYHLKDGDLIIAMTDVTPEKNLIGRMAIVETNQILLLNQRVGLLRLDKNKVNPYFLKVLSNMKDWRTYCIGSASLGVQANIGTKDITNGKMTMPNVEKQNEIAEILIDMDNEIRLALTKLQKLKYQKQGMIQALLTGKIRLI